MKRKTRFAHFTSLAFDDCALTETLRRDLFDRDSLIPGCTLCRENHILNALEEANETLSSQIQKVITRYDPRIGGVRTPGADDFLSNSFIDV